MHAGVGQIDTNDRAIDDAGARLYDAGAIERPPGPSGGGGIDTVFKMDEATSLVRARWAWYCASSCSTNTKLQQLFRNQP